jgi:hypothetical protein
MQWTLEENRLVLRHPRIDLFWEMPSGYSMPSEPLLNLAEYLLLRGLGEVVPAVQGGREAGRKIGLAYSGGVDSTAAFRLLPDSIPVYTEVAFPGRLHKIENAKLALAEVGGFAVRTNSDELAREYGKPRGFYGTGGFTVPLVLLADHLDLGVVADGNVLETAYLHSKHGHGTAYQPKNYDAVFRRFRGAGLEYCMPCAGLTEVSTTRLAEGFQYAMGCMRGTGGQPCNNCAKCYRKRALQGNPIAPCVESEAKVSRELVPMLPSLLWAVRNKGLQHPLLDRLSKDIAWVDKWYPDSKRFIPDGLLPAILARLEDYDIETLEDDLAIREWVSSKTVS